MKKLTARNILFYGILLINLSLIDKANAFTVELFKSTADVKSLSDADAVIGGTNLESTSSGIYDVIDFRDVAYFRSGESFWGHSDIDNFFPGSLPPNKNNYAVLVTGTVEITTADDWTFLTSNDDGVRLRIDGSDVIVDDALHATQDNISNPINLSAGEHEIELVMFEHGGEGTLELWAAQGTHTAFNDTDFQLVGDVANGGIAEVPWDFSPSMGMILSLIFFSLYKKYRKS